MQTIFSDAPARGGAQLQNPVVWVDAASDLFVGWLQAYVDPQNTIYIIRKYHDGVQVGEWRKQPDDHTLKADGGYFAPSGDALIVVLVVHGGGSPRPLHVMMEPIPGVFAPYHAGEMPAGAPGAVIPGSEDGGGMTLEDFRLGLVTDGAFRHDFKNFIKTFVGEVLDEKKVVTEGMFLDGDHGGSYVVWKQLENTSYEGAKNAIRDMGAPK